MNAAASELWFRLLDLLGERGVLPAGYEMLTPAELVAAVVSSTGDARVSAFVQDYYYPRHFGGCAGAISDEEAGRIIAGIEAQLPQPTFPRAGRASNLRPGEHPCSLCLRRPAERQNEENR